MSKMYILEVMEHVDAIRKIRRTSRQTSSLGSSDVPVNGYFEIGIDLNSWTAGPMFKGIKLIPPGIHFVFYRQLDEALENMGVEEEKREAELKKFTVQSRSFFSSIPLAPKYADPKDLTAYHMDKSLLLETLVQREYDGNPNGLLGEIQYAFIIFLLAQVYEGFEQWKTLVTLVLSCERAIYDSNYVKFFKNFLIAIRKQLKHINEDFFVEPISETFLQYHLKSFFDCLDEGTNIDHDLISAATKLKSFVKKKFRMNFELVLNDEAPVVVEIEEDKLST
ncbi:protein AAR2 homolog [Schistocerca gregaria]|uniref:protein AAR2 homolog n=1 Tax=Schistocerca gregaria TaxID=7010 RepID=UPI00211F0F8E|nr:protein AAR2 homolog [Schistocerca gregaria]